MPSHAIPGGFRIAGDVSSTSSPGMKRTCTSGASSSMRPWNTMASKGAGKTTFATEFLPKMVECREFLNADLIAAGLSPFAPETQNVHAGRLLLGRIGELTKQREDFGFETTLSGRTYAQRLVEMKRA